MGTGPEIAVRRVLLEGFVLRLARCPDVEAFALRGGMRMRQVFVGRTVGDVDLVWRGGAFPELRPLVGRVLSTPLDDGARFDAERFRIDDVVVRGRRMGARVVAAGWVNGVGADFTVDVHRRLDFGSEPIRRPLQVERGTGHLWMCEPETLIGRKARVTASLGPRSWRPKDLADLYRLVRHPSLDRDRLAAGLHAGCDGCPDARDAVREAFGSPSWWTNRRARARWRQWAPRPECERLPAMIDTVTGVLSDVLGRPA